MTMRWGRVSPRLGWLAAGAAAVVLLGVGGLVVSRVLAPSDPPSEPPRMGGIAAADLLGEAATRLVDSASPAPDCAGRPAPVPD
ncbi:MAG: hypothetical protein ACRDT2_23440, partial [Natronosporangium sp.]